MLLSLSGLFLKEGVFGNSWVIVANGPTLHHNELKKQMIGRKVLALDGAVNRFRSWEIYPDYILGDFDSVKDPAYWGISASFSEISENSLPYKGNYGITIIPAKDQNYTDLEKGIIFCDKAKAAAILVVQATGGRMDLTLENLGLLKKYHRTDRPLSILTDKEQIFYLSNAKIVVEGGRGEICSIFGYPQANMTTFGLAYNGEHFPLKLGHQESVSNRIVDQSATILIEGEALVMLPKSSNFKVLSE